MRDPADVLAEHLPRGQWMAERLMQDQVLIERRAVDDNGEPVRVMDPETLAYEDSWTLVYDDKARVQRPSSTSDHAAEAGEYVFGVESVLAQLPLSATGIKRGDRLTVTALGPLSDPDLLGVVATVRANLTKTHPTKRTLICEEVSS